ncbi:MAG TPA: alginate export family protein [Alphaproteobacteria bacterium]
MTASRAACLALGFCLCLALPGPVGAADERARVGGVERVEGAATASYGEDRRDLAAADPVLFGDLLETGADARLLARLLDESTITLGADASLLVDEFVYDPGAGARVVALRNLAGAFVLAVNDLKGLVEQRVEVATRVGTVSVERGTVWGGELDDGFALLALDGTVMLVAETGTVRLAEGEGVTITSPAEPMPVALWPRLKVERALQSVAFKDGRVTLRPDWRDQDDPVAALTGGRPSLDLRYRFERVDQDGFAKRAAAHTVRTRLGFETGALFGFRAMLEGQNVFHIGYPRFDDTVNGRSAYPVVADPDNTEFDQYWIASEHVPRSEIKLGRQRIILDNHRFVGNVGFRQTEQTFDAVRVTTGLIPGVTADYAYLALVNRVFGEDSPVGDFETDSHLIHLSRYQDGIGHLAGYGYLVDINDRPALSSKTFGLRLNGRRQLGEPWWLLYQAEAAWQSGYANNPNDDDFAYYLVEPGAAYASTSLRLGYEVLGGNGRRALQTPLATLHAFQGTADVFPTTPPDGIADLYLGLNHIFVAPLWLTGTRLSVVGHRFAAERGGAHYGDELDAEIAYPLHDRVMLRLEYAVYDAQRFAADTQKIWASVSFSY